MAYKSVFDVTAIKSEFELAGLNPIFIPLIWKHVLKNPNCRWDEIDSLPSAAYHLLDSKFRPSTSTLHSAIDSSDQVTTKLLIKLKVGCKMGCKFCATGSMGFKSNLSSGEILEQLVHASRISTIRNVVFMGMGEPLNNYSAVVDAIRAMTAAPFQLSPRKITVSTVGVIHAINKLKIDLPNLNLAVSLHAPVQEIRCQIMPAARAFPLEKLMNALRAYQTSSQQKILIEYIMLDTVNDEEEHAHQLGKLLETCQSVVNLIPFNPIGSLSSYRTSDDEKVAKFQKILRETYNIRTTIRKQMGQDISGACGQLVIKLPDILTDIEDLRI